VNLIDPKIVVTQILGFIVLVWALRKWAFGPVMAILEQRRQAIATEFQTASDRQAEAEKLRTQYEQELRGIEAKARARLQEAIAEGQRLGGEIQTLAQTEASRRLQQAQDEIAREREKAKEILKEQMIQLSVRAAEKILRQKLDDATQRKLAGEFIDEVAAIQ
jgi:F-type H+-transporting ATPase subunit b